MTGKLLALNIIYTFTDVVVATLCILGFAWCAWHFDKWWMMLFTLIPLVLFNSHSTLISMDMEAAEEGGEEDD